MEHYGHGIVRAPRHVEGATVDDHIKTAVDSRAGSEPRAPPVELPAFPRGEQLLNHYYATVHQAYPLVPWPRLQAAFDRAYHEGLDRLPSDARALLLGVFACGALRDGEEAARPFLNHASAAIAPFAAGTHLTLDAVRATALAAIAHAEMNRPAAAFVMLGTAVRAAQDMGLHQRSAVRTVAEEDARYNLWWSLYSLERWVPVVGLDV